MQPYAAHLPESVTVVKKTLSSTRSVCPECLAAVPATRVVGDDSRIYLEKTCSVHGSFSTLIWDGDEGSYLAWGASRCEEDGTCQEDADASDNCPRACGLCEHHENPGCCVLLELTKRCNLRCPVCFASAGEDSDLAHEDIEGILDMLMERGGPFNLQLSGGEPTTCDDLPWVAATARQKGFSYLQLNTNGIRIAQESGYVQALLEAGISCVFLQFDGLRDSTYLALRGQPLLDAKMKAVEACADVGLPVVLVPTVAPGVNVDELGAILRFALASAPNVQGVHIQPISYMGRCPSPAAERVTIPLVMREIERQTGGLMKASDFAGRSVENPYCSFHASYLNDNGKLVCLHKKRSGCCDVLDSQGFVARTWGASTKPDNSKSCCSLDSGELSLDEFMDAVRERTFVVSGMVFQDAWNLDLERLRRCYIIESDLEHGMVPFCAYNLTDANGKAMYRS